MYRNLLIECTPLLIGKIATAEVSASNSFDDFIQHYVTKINTVADEVEKAHSTKLERHAP